MICTIIEEHINFTLPWDLFDGASEGDPSIGGVGGVIYLSDHRKISFKFALGHATNKKDELSSLCSILRIDKKNTSQEYTYMVT